MINLKSLFLLLILVLSQFDYLEHSFRVKIYESKSFHTKVELLK